MRALHVCVTKGLRPWWLASVWLLGGLLALPGCGDEAGVVGPEPAGSGGGAGHGGSTTTSTGVGGAGGEEPSCPDAPPLDTSALGFDGDDAVSMGAAPELGTELFTLEAWVRRDGRGTDASTGAGGLRLVPLVTKGRGENDGENVDCNYALGLVGDVLGADFEDYESGANHPVLGSTPLREGRWHHVAATFDGSLFRLYLDGVLDAEAPVEATPRYDSIQHFGLGVAFNSEGVAAGHFVGALDEVRVYSRALSEAELRATMYTTTPAETGLIGHFHLDVDDDAVVDSSGNDNDGVLTGTSFIEPGAVLDRGAAPTIDQPSVELGADEGASLAVDVADPDDEPILVDFYARELTAADDFTIVVLPDSQYYTRDGDDPSYFAAQTGWAVEHRADRNVVGVCHVGDMVNNASIGSQWQNLVDGFEILEALDEPGMPDGLPYSPCVGNHDEYPNGETDATTAYNEHLGLWRFEERAYFGGARGDDNDDHWMRFRAGDLEIIVVSLQFNADPDPAVLAWARRVFQTHPGALGIVTAHSIVAGDGEFSVQGAAIYEAVKDLPNVQLTASGHVSVDARRTDEFEGNVIHSMLSDYQRSAPDPDDPSQPLVGEQGLPNGGRGFMRIWRFSPAEQLLYVESYSPKEDISYTDDRNQFELPVDIVGAGGPFVKLGTVAAVEGQASIDLAAYAPGKSFEWYAVATDCVHETPLEVQLLAAVDP